MQTIKSFFEYNTVWAQIVGTPADTNILNEDRTVYATPITFYSGVNNPIRFWCLNSDQQRISVSNLTIQMAVFEPGTTDELFVVSTTGVDTANGIIQALVTPGQLAPLSYGDYEIGVTAVDNTGNVFPVYIDDHYGSRLNASLQKGPVLIDADPTPVTFLDISGVGAISNQVNLVGRPTNSTLATLEANLIAYSGNIIAQGTMVSTPGPTDWGNVSATYYGNVSGLVYQNVIGSFAYIRFMLDSVDPNGWGNITVSNYISGANIRI